MDEEIDRMEAEFTTKLSKWVNKQGMLFQLRHAANSGAMAGTLARVFFKLMGLMILFAVLGAIALWFYLDKKYASPGFKAGMERRLQQGMHASSSRIKGVTRIRDGVMNAKLKLGTIKLGGSEESLYEDWLEPTAPGADGVALDEKVRMSIRSVVIEPLGLAEGIKRNWSATSLDLVGLRMHLKTGATTDQLAQLIYVNFLSPRPGILITKLSIQDAHITWGYGDNTGAIVGANIEAQLIDGAWRLEVSGGTFSHSWLKECAIKQMKLDCHSNGLVKITSAEFNIGKVDKDSPENQAVMSFNAEIRMAAQPTVTGKYAFQNVKVLDLVGEEYSDWLSGTLSGEGELSGTLNSSKDVIATTSITLGRTAGNAVDSMLMVRGAFPFLGAIQNIDKAGSYKQLRFREGKFVVEHGTGETIVRELDVVSENDIRFLGGFTYEGGVGPNDKTFSGEMQAVVDATVFREFPGIPSLISSSGDASKVKISVPMERNMKRVTGSVAEKINKLIMDSREK